MEPLPIGKYNRYAVAGEAYNIIDSWGMMRSIFPDDDGGDNLGANMRVTFIYDDPYLAQTSSSLWGWDVHGRFVGQRHPNLSPDVHPMSRDHYVTTLVTLKLDGPDWDWKIKLITDNIGYVISSMARRPLGLKWWSQALLGNKLPEILFYLFEILAVVFIYRPVHAVGSWIADYGDEVDQEDYEKGDAFQLQKQPKYKQVIDKIIYPSYALLLKGFQLYVLEDSRLKRVLQKLYLPMVGKTNYVQQMFFGKKGIPRDKIESFKSMKGGRWSGYLSSRNDRDMKVHLIQVGFNNMDVDLARKLFNETQI